MDGDSELEAVRLRVTREALASGSLLRDARRRAPPGMHVLSDDDLAASLDRTLAGHDPAQDVWVFGYGSLIWNPAIAFDAQRAVLVRGWHRRFCLTLTMGRGAPDRPGLMLALDRGGACRGVAFRITAVAGRTELMLLWRREMFAGSYQARWVTAENGTQRVPALTFVANRTQPRYAGALSEAEIVQRLATASGHLGSCRAYLENTVEALHALGIADPVLDRLYRKVMAVGAVVSDGTTAETQDLPSRRRGFKGRA